MNYPRANYGVSENVTQQAAGN